MILIDAGPLVALINPADPGHQSCRETLGQIDESIGTVWPVLTKAMHFSPASWRAQSVLWQMVERGTVEILPLTIDDVPRMNELMEKYRDLPMDLADAALVRVAEREKIRRVFTLDQRGFALYRPLGIGRFTLLPRPRRS